MNTTQSVGWSVGWSRISHFAGEKRTLISCSFVISIYRFVYESSIATSVPFFLLLFFSDWMLQRIRALCVLFIHFCSINGRKYCCFRVFFSTVCVFVGFITMMTQRISIHILMTWNEWRNRLYSILFDFGMLWLDARLHNCTPVNCDVWKIIMVQYLGRCEWKLAFLCLIFRHLTSLNTHTRTQ